MKCQFDETSTTISREEAESQQNVLCELTRGGWPVKESHEKIAGGGGAIFGADLGGNFGYTLRVTLINEQGFDFAHGSSGIVFLLRNAAGYAEALEA